MAQIERAVEMARVIRVLIAGPYIGAKGGVANFYRAVLPALKKTPRLEVTYVPVGSAVPRSNPVADQVRFWRALRRTNPHVVHLNPSIDVRSVVRDTLLSIAARKRKIPLVVFFRGWQWELWNSWLWRKCIGRVLLQGCQRALVLGTVFRDALLKEAPLLAAELVTTAVEDWLWERGRWAWAEREQRLVAASANIHTRGPVLRLLFLARLEPEKGLLEVLKALQTLQRDRGEDYSLDVAGEGVALPAAKNEAARCGLNDLVAFHGHVEGEAKADLLARADAYVLPTRYGEGLPNSVLEAMSFGLPIICTTAGGLANLIVDGDNGFLVTGDAAAVAEAISKIKPATARLRIGRNNMQKSKDFCGSRVAARLAHTYREVAETHE